MTPSPHAIALQHIPHFDNWFEPTRRVVLAAIAEALATPPCSRKAAETPEGARP